MRCARRNSSTTLTTTTAPATRDTPFRVTTELAPAPWNAQRQLLMIGIKGYELPRRDLPPSNLVFLLDTSGSMDAQDKLPLLKRALAMLVPQLRAQDRVSIVVYAGSAGLVLPPTAGDQHDKILAALDQLEAGGSTNGGAGIGLAYAVARQGFIPGGSNRVILATDGDFNVGTVSQDALETLVGDGRAAGIALTTLGLGQGNYNDALAERLADVGDGNHAYIDSDQEARKVLVQQMQGTLLTIARDVKIQVEFNPAAVAEYRLIGYENRGLRREDFANDKVDAGDIGAGHEVTALYELTPTGSQAARLQALRYGAKSIAGGDAREVAQLRLRYKRPGQQTSALIETPILADALRRQPSESARFASAVAGYADLLRGGSRFDGWTSALVLIGYSIPGFVLGVFLLVVFGGGSFLQWFPLRGLTSDNWDTLSTMGKITDYLWHITLPVLASVAGAFAIMTMLTRNTFLDEVRKQYVLTARAKGLSERKVLYKHVFRNALIPLVTGFPAAFVGAFFTGSLLIETLFSLDGLGLLSYESVIRRDYPVRHGAPCTCLR